LPRPANNRVQSRTAASNCRTAASGRPLPVELTPGEPAWAGTGQKRTFNARVKDLRIDYLLKAPMLFDETSLSCDDVIAKIAIL